MSPLVTVITPEKRLDVAHLWHEIEAQEIRGQHALMFPRLAIPLSRLPSIIYGTTIVIWQAKAEIVGE